MPFICAFLVYEEDDGTPRSIYVQYFQFVKKKKCSLKCVHFRYQHQISGLTGSCAQLKMKLEFEKKQNPSFPISDTFILWNSIYS